MLVNRGRVVTVLIQPSLLESENLAQVNMGKRGKPFRYSTGLISAIFAVKCAFRIGYRQLEGFASDVSQSLKLTIPNFRTIWWRIDKMKTGGVTFNIHGKTVVAVDSTGLRPVNDGEYRAMKYDKRREWIKLHVAFDTYTKQFLNVTITKGNLSDCIEFKNLIKPVLPFVTKIIADKGYDSGDIFRFCENNNVIPCIPVRLNSANSSKNRRRRCEIEDQLGLILKRGSTRTNRHLTRERRLENQERWKKRSGYGKRSLIESGFSQYKRVLGENLFSRKRENIEKEIIAKVNLLNKFVLIN